MASVQSPGTEFIPNRSRKNMRIMYAAMGLCMLIGLAMFISGAVTYMSTGEETDVLGAGAAFFGISLGFLLLAHFLTVPYNVHYYVGQEGITIQAFRTVKMLPYAEIKSVTALEENQSEKFMLELQHKLVEKQREQLSAAGEGSLNPFRPIASAFREQRKAFEKYKFLSVAIAYSSTGRQRGPVKASSVDLPCPTVFILLKNGEGYFISPLDTRGFANEAKKHLAV